ncbi:lipopolysaccharide biosynthesis protein [Kiloniella sp. b19]|uniref:lipopolysaccharide biosynthesis protein n=1 Tax=Kiloniella sp. GXU_MW_B19 TaxID=3141326 RepID=UPI0031DD3008
MSNTPLSPSSGLPGRWRTLPQSLKDSVFYAAGILATKGIGFIMIPVFTAFLSPADYGRLDILQTLADLFSIVLMLGLGDALFRYYGMADRDDRNTVLRNIFGLSCLLSLVFSVSLQLLAPLILSVLPGEIDIISLRALLLSLGLSIGLFIPLCNFRMQGRALDYFKTSTGRVIMQAALAAGLLYQGFGVNGVMLATAATSLFWVLKNTAELYRENGIAFDLHLWKRYLGYGAPLIVAGLAGFVLRSFDRLLLADTIGVAAMAPYALAAKFGLLAALIVYPFELYWQPKKFAVLSQENGSETCARMISLGLVLSALAALFMSLAAPYVIVLITPGSYHDAVHYIAPLCFFASLHFATQQVNLGLLSGTSTKWQAIIDCLAACLAFGGYLLLIPLTGTWGAILATGLVLSARLIVTYAVSQRFHHLPYNLSALTVLLGSTGITIGFLTHSLQAHSLFDPDHLLFGLCGTALVIWQAHLTGLLPSLDSLKAQMKGRDNAGTE